MTDLLQGRGVLSWKVVLRLGFKVKGKGERHRMKVETPAFRLVAFWLPLDQSEESVT